MKWYPTRGLWIFLSQFSLVLACSHGAAPVAQPVAPGTLRGTLSLQVTSAKPKTVLFNAAAFAERLDGPLRRELKEHAFELSDNEARQHLIVHVRDAGRGTGTVRFFCELEFYVYSKWPGALDFGRNQGQTADGELSDAAPNLHASFRIENRRREQAGEGTEIDQGAQYCAEQLTTELLKLRERAPALVEASPAPVSTEPGVARAKTPTAPQPPLQFPAAFEVVRSLEVAPGNLTVTPAGQIIVSLHQFFQPEFPVAAVDDSGSLTEFAKDAQLDSVLGVQSDENGVVWLLDNGMKSTKKARLVGYHSVREKVVADIDLTSVMPKDAFFNDLVIDLDHEAAYLADPAGGKNAAIVVVDLKTGKARRLLEGHKSVTPEDIDLVVDGETLEIQRPDGTVQRPRVGVNPLAADARNEWLHFGPMHGSSLYRIRTESLRDPSLSPETLSRAVERFSDKPITDGISIDRKGNVYLGDLPNNAIVRISPAGEMSTIASGPELSWVNDFSFGPDGHLYAVVNQLHRSPPFGRGADLTKPPFLIIKLEPEARGIVGR